MAIARAGRASAAPAMRDVRRPRSCRPRTARRSHQCNHTVPAPMARAMSIPKRHRACRARITAPVHSPSACRRPPKRRDERPPPVELHAWPDQAVGPEPEPRRSPQSGQAARIPPGIAPKVGTADKRSRGSAASACERRHGQRPARSSPASGRDVQPLARTAAAGERVIQAQTRARRRYRARAAAPKVRPTPSVRARSPAPV